VTAAGRAFRGRFPKPTNGSPLARLLLVAALAVVPVGSAAASGGAQSGLCAPSQLRVTAQTQGVSTTAWIGVTVRNAGGRCTLAGRVVVEVQQNSRRAAVKGNPLAIPVRGILGHGHTRLVKAVWNNWCRSRAGLRLVVRYAGTTIGKRFHVLPVCIDRRRASQLLPID
jgi:hypothetical protein